MTNRPGRAGQQVVIWCVGLLVVAVMVLLGLWQMQTFRNQGHDAMVARMTQPAVPLESVVRLGEMPQDAYGRPVTTRGRFLAEQQLLIPERTGADRYRVLTPLILADGSVVPVVRGIATGTRPPAPPGGEVSVTGLFLPTEADPERELPDGQLDTVRIPRIAQLWPQQLTPGFLSLDAAGSSGQGLEHAEVPVPNSAGHSRNSGYALQWWLFAAAAAAATVKISRDARTGTGFMRSKPVDNPVGGPGDGAVDKGVDTVDDSPAETGGVTGGGPSDKG